MAGRPDRSARARSRSGRDRRLARVLRRSPARPHGSGAGGRSMVLRVGVRGWSPCPGSDSVVEERRLGPVVGLGTSNTCDADADLARRVVGAALAAGCRVFDSSPMYRGAQRSLAAALEGRREEAVVATKIWAPSPDEAELQLTRQLEWYGH